MNLRPPGPETAGQALNSAKGGSLVPIIGITPAGSHPILETLLKPKISPQLLKIPPRTTVIEFPANASDENLSALKSRRYDLSTTVIGTSCLAPWSDLCYTSSSTCPAQAIADQNMIFNWGVSVRRLAI